MHELRVKLLPVRVGPQREVAVHAHAGRVAEPHHVAEEVGSLEPRCDRRYLARVPRVAVVRHAERLDDVRPEVPIPAEVLRRVRVGIHSRRRRPLVAPIEVDAERLDGPGFRSRRSSLCPRRRRCRPHEHGDRWEAEHRGSAGDDFPPIPRARRGNADLVVHCPPRVFAVFRIRPGDLPVIPTAADRRRADEPRSPSHRRHAHTVRSTGRPSIALCFRTSGATTCRTNASVCSTLRPM